MKILYTTKEGGYWKGLEIKVGEGDIFAICLPDGTIWDRMIGVDKFHRIEKDEFEKLYDSDGKVIDNSLTDMV